MEKEDEGLSEVTLSSLIEACFRFSITFFLTLSSTMVSGCPTYDDRLQTCNFIVDTTHQPNTSSRRCLTAYSCKGQVWLAILFASVSWFTICGKSCYWKRLPWHAGWCKWINFNTLRSSSDSSVLPFIYGPSFPASFDIFAISTLRCLESTMTTLSFLSPFLVFCSCLFPEWMWWVLLNMGILWYH